MSFFLLCLTKTVDIRRFTKYGLGLYLFELTNLKYKIKQVSGLVLAVYSLTDTILTRLGLKS